MLVVWKYILCLPIELMAKIAEPNTGIQILAYIYQAKSKRSECITLTQALIKS
jgi:hypothetical protein